MERLKRGLSFRKKKNHVPESSKPHQWQEDERKVRDGTCSFQVRYLGCIEVFESRGIQVCEEAVKALKSKQSRSIWSRMSMRKKKRDKENQAQEVDNEANEEGGKQCKGKYQRAILYVSGDALRVVDEISKGLIVDQTIEKVSFCAPDRHQEKGFAYICRDGTTRRWMCHGFLAMKESGERLSHAVGCAFAICLERKQKREKESVQVTFNDNMTSFTRTGSFRQTTLTERLADPQVAIVAEPVPVREAVNPHAVQRPHATDAMLERQSSFRGFNKLAESSPFKRQMSLRLNELPSTLDRQKQLGINGPHNGFSNGAVSTVTSIPEASPTKEQEESISEMCQQLTQGLSALTTTEDPFASAPQNAGFNNPGLNTHTTAQMANPAFSQNIPAAGPVHQTNPWSSPAAPYSAGPTTASRVSDAEFWLHSTATSIAASSSPGPSTMPQQQPPQLSAHQPLNGHHQVPTSIPPHHPQATTQWQQQQHQQQQQQQQQHQQQQFAASILHQRAPHLAQIRSHSLDTPPSWQQQAAAQHFQPPRQPPATAPGPPPTPPQHQPAATFDPFDAAWAAKGKQAKNPFQPGDSVTKTFEVNL